MQSLIRKSLTRTTCTTLCILNVGIVLKILRASLILLSLVVDARVMYVYIEGVLRYSVSQKVYLCVNQLKGWWEIWSRTLQCRRKCCILHYCRCIFYGPLVPHTSDVCCWRGVGNLRVEISRFCSFRPRVVTILELVYHCIDGLSVTFLHDKLPQAFNCRWYHIV